MCLAVHDKSAARNSEPLFIQKSEGPSKEAGSAILSRSTIPSTILRNPFGLRRWSHTSKGLSVDRWLIGNSSAVIRRFLSLGHDGRDGRGENICCDTRCVGGHNLFRSGSHLLNQTRACDKSYY